MKIIKPATVQRGLVQRFSQFPVERTRLYEANSSSGLKSGPRTSWNARSAYLSERIQEVQAMHQSHTGNKCTELL